MIGEEMRGDRGEGSLEGEKENGALRKRITARTPPLMARKELKLTPQISNSGMTGIGELLRMEKQRHQLNNNVEKDDASHHYDQIDMGRWDAEEGWEAAQPPATRRVPLSRSKSQSRNNLAVLHQRQQQHFLMGRSKTATNLAAPFTATAGASTASSTLLSRHADGTTGGRPFARRGATTATRRKLSLQRCRPLFSQAQAAVIELFDAEDSERRWEAREREGMGAIGQFERIQRELRDLAERRLLALGRERRVRVADLGADQLRARLAARLAKRGKVSVNRVDDINEAITLLLQKPAQKPLHEYYNDDDAELEGG